MSTELAIQKPGHSGEIFFPTKVEWDHMLAWGGDAIKSGMLPQGIKTKEAAAIVVLKGRELGIPFMVAISHIHVINGKTSSSAELMQMLARKNLPGIQIVPTENTDQKASVKIKRPEAGSEWFHYAFTMDDAKKADLLKNPTWSKYPKAMLWSRCISAALRIVCPEALNGMSYTHEEMSLPVDEAGNVIETTGRRMEEELKEPLKEVKEQDSPAWKAEAQAIKALKLDLGISDEDLKSEIHRMGLPTDYTKVSTAQMKQIATMLSNQKKRQEEDVPGEWEKEAAGPPVGVVKQS